MARRTTPARLRSASLIGSFTSIRRTPVCQALGIEAFVNHPASICASSIQTILTTRKRRNARRNCSMRIQKSASFTATSSLPTKRGRHSPHTVMIRRSVLAAVGDFDGDLGGNADYELWLRVSAAGHRACFIDEKLAYYRTYPTSMSKDGQHMTETRVAAFRKICRQYPDLVGQALSNLQQSNQDLFVANGWLN